MKVPLETQLQLPFSLQDYRGMRESIHVDQAPIDNRSVYGTFFCCMTVYGVQQLESDFIHRIMNFEGTDAERQALRNEIIHNPHLHSVIKRNLVENLDAR